MGALFDAAAVIRDEDEAHIANDGESVGDDEADSAFH